jgi:hypothetical protein
VDVLAFVLGAVSAPGIVVLSASDLAACALLFAVVSLAVRLLTPYVIFPVVLVTLMPAFLLVNGGLVWGIVLAGRALGLGIGVTGAIPVFLVAFVIGVVRLTAAVVACSVWPLYEAYVARSDYKKMDRARMWYREQLDWRRASDGAPR